MVVIRSLRIVFVQVPQMVMIFSYSGMDFALLIPALQFIHLRSVGREVAREDWGIKAVKYLGLPLSVVTSLPVFLIKVVHFFTLPLLAEISVEALLIILCIPCQIQLQSRLVIPDPILTQLHNVSILFLGYLFLLSLPVHFLLVL